MGFLGLSFGAKKQSGSQKSDIDKTVNLTGTQNTTTNSSGTTNTTGTTSGVTTNTQSQSGLTTQDQSETQKGTNKTVGLTTTLGSGVIDALTQSVNKVLGGGINDTNLALLNNMILGKGDFNASQFVTDTVGAARNRGEQQLQESNSAFQSGVGGTAGSNTMAALLAARGRNDLESALAGIRGEATARAEGIENENIGAVGGAQQNMAGMGAALVEALKGGSTTTDVTQLTDQISALLAKGATTGTTTEAGTQSQTQVSTTEQLLKEIADALTNQTERTVGTEKVDQKGKQLGGGISIGL